MAGKPHKSRAITPYNQRARNNSQTKEFRVEEIARRMSSMQWFTGITNRELAAEWGVGLDAMAQYAAEASRIVRRDIGSSEEVRSRAIMALERVSQAASSLGKRDARYFQVAVQAIALMTGLGGAPPTTRSEVTGAEGKPIGPVIAIPAEDE